MNHTSIEWCTHSANPIKFRRADDPTGQPGHPCRWDYKPRDRKGGDMAEWTEDLRVREMPV